MQDIKSSISQMNALELSAQKNTIIHRLQAPVKIITTVIYLLIIISYGQGQVSRLIPCFFYPALVMALGEIPFKTIAGRLLIALPFSLFAGISNLMFSRETAFILGGIVVTAGMVSFASIMLKTALCVTAVLILIATTDMNGLAYGMLSLRVPPVIVTQIMLTYRYIGVIAEEASVMRHAYLLRAPNEKGIRMKDMGAFLGQLIIRSFDRSERIYNAMKCRGYEGRIAYSDREKISLKGWAYITVTSIFFLLLRFVNVSTLVGSLFL